MPKPGNWFFLFLNIPPCVGKGKGKSSLSPAVLGIASIALRFGGKEYHSN